MGDVTDAGPYFSVSRITVNPSKIEEAFACCAEIAKATAEEPGAQIYRFYKTEGKNEIVFIEKFKSRELYTAHVQSAHVRDWADRYLKSGIFEGTFEFYPLSKQGNGIGGFDRQ